MPHFFALPPAGDAAQPGEAFAKPLAVSPALAITAALVAGVHLRSGDLCPQCQGGPLDYDGLLNLTCARCGYTPGGGCFS
jgi:hypothetical protein